MSRKGGSRQPGGPGRPRWPHQTPGARRANLGWGTAAAAGSARARRPAAGTVITRVSLSTQARAPAHSCAPHAASTPGDQPDRRANTPRPRPRCKASGPTHAPASRTIAWRAQPCPSCRHYRVKRAWQRTVTRRSAATPSGQSGQYRCSHQESAASSRERRLVRTARLPIARRSSVARWAPATTPRRRRKSPIDHRGTGLPGRGSPYARPWRLSIQTVALRAVVQSRGDALFPSACTRAYPTVAWLHKPTLGSVTVGDAYPAKFAMLTPVTTKGTAR